MLSFEDLLDAYEWVSADPSYENTAYVNRSTGAVYWDTDAADTSEELPDDIEDGTKYIAVPHKHDLDLGKSLVFEFADEHIQDDVGKVSGFFRRPGAYGKFKDLLERRNLLETWYEFERKRTEIAFHHWAAENSIPLSFPSGTNAA